jgi:hypothetical protein
MPISGMYRVRELNYKENWLLQYKFYKEICSVKKGKKSSINCCMSK